MMHLSQKREMSNFYTQGQLNEKNKKIREYFYYIDHQGMVRRNFTF